MSLQQNQVPAGHGEITEVRERLNLGFDAIEAPPVASIPTGQTYKSFGRFIMIALILTISSFQFGFCLCQVSLYFPWVWAVRQRLDWPLSVLYAVHVAAMPIGGIFGHCLSRNLLIFFSRKKVHYATCPFAVASCGIIQLRYVEAILLSRFLIGMYCGILTACAAQHLKEIAPVKLRPLMSSLFSLGQIFGCVICFTLSTIFIETGVFFLELYVLFPISGGLAIVQCLLIGFLVPDSPVQMLEKNQIYALREYVVQFYRPEAVETVIGEYIADLEMQQMATAAAIVGSDQLSANRTRAFRMAIHLNIYHQFIGINTILVISGYLIIFIAHDLAFYINLIVSVILFVCMIISSFWLRNLIGRRPLYLISGVLLTLCSLLIALGYLFEVYLLIVIPMCFYTAFFGLFCAPALSYPAEIIPTAQYTFVSTFNWIALALIILIPPIVIEYMNFNAYAIFFFFSGYTAFSLIYMYLCLVETKGLNYKQIIEKY